MITITDNARKHFEEMMEDHGHEAYMFGASGGGCSGFNYLLKDVKLDEKQDIDEVFEFGRVKIIVDGASLFAIIGTEIDYKTDVMGSRFEFGNPQSKSSCGCGESFSV